jgi:allantoate deiminase
MAFPDNKSQELLHRRGKSPAWGEVAQQRLTDIAACSLPGAGVTRLPFTKEHRQANAIITDWMQAASLNVTMDAAGTLIGRRAGGGARARRTFIMGSHQDSVRNGGRYDGIMGVALACLAVEKIIADDHVPDYSIEVHAYADEEGVRFPTALLGPRALAGTFDPSVLKMCDAQGVSVASALAEFGGKPERLGALARHPGDILGYLEAHIEQGPVLEAAGLAVGTVTSICGIERNVLTIHGKTGHAGTVPMQGRQDALVAASRIIAGLSERACAVDELRATFGTLDVLPGAVNQIPETVTVSLEIRSPRDTDREAFRTMAAAYAAKVAEASGCRAGMKQTYVQVAQQCHQPFVDKLQAVTKAADGSGMLLASGATHDASAMAALCPMVMLFIRCRDGVSHTPEEYASSDDMGVAIDVMARFLKSI